VGLLSQAVTGPPDSGGLRAGIAGELDRLAVGRDHPVHRALVAGALDRPALRQLATQQWHFHAAFPGILAALASQCRDRVVRGAILADAYDQESGALSGAGRLEMWEAVCACWGLDRRALAGGTALPATEAMIALQASVARRPFAEGYVGIMVGVYGESAPHMEARRAAMERHYGVRPEALRYFGAQSTEDVVERVLRQIGSTATAQRGALEALRLVLQGRWAYFSAIGGASGSDCA
jgi:pyrroloquinoline-quinone synthase